MAQRYKLAVHHSCWYIQKYGTSTRIATGKLVHPGRKYSDLEGVLTTLEHLDKTGLFGKIGTYEMPELLELEDDQCPECQNLLALEFESHRTPSGETYHTVCRFCTYENSESV